MTREEPFGGEPHARDRHRHKRVSEPARRSALGWLLGVMLLLVPGCHIDDQRPSSAADEPPTPVVQAFDAEQLGEGCQPDTVLQIVTDFVDSYNAGDSARLASLLPSESVSATVTQSLTAASDVFQVFFMNLGDGSSFSAATPEDTITYVIGRHEGGERLQLTELRIRPWGRYGEAVDIDYSLERRADSGQTIPMFGKGRISCEKRQIVLWGMADE